jgi:hypothetical protein
MRRVFICVFPLPDIIEIKESGVELYSNREDQSVVISCYMKSVITREWTHEFGSGSHSDEISFGTVSWCILIDHCKYSNYVFCRL